MSTTLKNITQLLEAAKDAPEEMQAAVIEFAHEALKDYNEFDRKLGERIKALQNKLAAEEKTTSQ